MMVFVLPSDGRVRDATNSLFQFERWSIPRCSTSIYEDQEEVNRKVLARLSDVCEKQFSNLGTNKDRIAAYLNESLRR